MAQWFLDMAICIQKEFQNFLENFHGTALGNYYLFTSKILNINLNTNFIIYKTFKYNLNCL